MTTNRDFDLVLQKAHFGENSDAIRLLVNIVKQQQEQIQNLQDKLCPEKPKTELEEVLEECRQMMDNGADQVEIFEWVEDNTDLDPAFIIGELF